MNSRIPISNQLFKPGQDWLDSRGKSIQAHGGGILYYEGTYYWYGENKDGITKSGGCGARVDVIGVSCYSSEDLYNWKFEGLVLKAVPGDPEHDLHPSGVVERPKVIYNATTKKFVMWMHIDNCNYKAARTGVAVADSPVGPFTYMESVRAFGQDSRDQTVFKDEDGKAYRIFSSEGNETTYIALLSDDYLRHTGKFAKVFEGRFMEAQTVFKRAGKYYFIASGCSGWAPNPARSAVADSILGPWTELGNPCFGADADRTFGAQSTYVFPVEGKKNAYIFMADRWNKDNLGDSRYVWLPLEFRDGKPAIEWREQWALKYFDAYAK